MSYPVQLLDGPYLAFAVTSSGWAFLGVFTDLTTANAAISSSVSQSGGMGFVVRAASAAVTP